jgi:V8-like Glu-specific endopeptidase
MEVSWGSVLEVGSLPSKENSLSLELPPTRAVVRAFDDPRVPSSWMNAFSKLYVGENEAMEFTAGIIETFNVINENNFREIPAAIELYKQKMARFLRAISSVGRIEVGNRSNELGQAFFGTGFLIGPKMLMTNHHVIRNQTDAENCNIWFKYDTDDRSNVVQVVGRRLLITNRGYDFSVVELEERPEENDTEANLDKGISFIDIQNHGGFPQAGIDFVNIIQHPHGGPKLYVDEDNPVTKTISGTIIYEADTDDGSSGSPVLNEDFRIVALHHTGGVFENKGSFIGKIRAMLTKANF